MNKPITLEFSVEDLSTYLASLDMAIALCETKVSHFSAEQHLRQLRERLMTKYVKVLS